MAGKGRFASKSDLVVEGNRTSLAARISASSGITLLLLVLLELV